MSGEQVKQKLIQGGVKVSELHTLLKTSPQNLSRGLNVADVKTGFIEKLCSVLNIDMSFFYGGTTFLPFSNIPNEQQQVPKFLYDDMQAKLLESVRENEHLRNQIALMEKGMTVSEIAQKEAV